MANGQHSLAGLCLAIDKLRRRIPFQPPAKQGIPTLQTQREPQRKPLGNSPVEHGKNGNLPEQERSQHEGSVSLQETWCRNHKTTDGKRSNSGQRGGVISAVL